jgi:tetratricopeptide (TPR) repeat protein
MLKDLFTFRFQIQESDKAKEAQDKIEAGFGEVLGVDDEGQMRAHITGQLLGFDFSESQYVKGILDDPQQIHDRALMYLAEYFQGMSKWAPLVIFLEDSHWADDSSLDMLNRLARRIPKQRLLIVCAARHRLYERRPHWGEGLVYHRRLELQPLSNLDSSQLVSEILQKVEQIPDSLQELVVKGAEGNPFYIEELIKMLVEDSIIITGEEKWQVEPERLAEIDVPDTLTGVLQARLEGLPQEERSTLQQASVVGHIFWDDTVAYINNQSRPIDTHYEIHTTDENLSSLRSRELIYHREESTFTDAAEYTFKHALLRDVTYESVLKRVRKAYHGLVAEWLIQHSEERVGEYTGLIADHLVLAGKKEQAAIYLYQAGEEAARRYANAEAVEYFSRALALIPEDDLVGRFDLLLAREKVLAVQGDRELQNEDLIALEEIAVNLDDPRRMAEVGLRKFIYYERISDLAAILNDIEEAIGIAQLAGDVDCEARLNLRWGRAHWQQGQLESAVYPLERALALSREHQLHVVEVDSMRVLGAVYGDLGDLNQYLSFQEQALEKSKQIGYLIGEAAALNNLGIDYSQRGYFQKARKYLSDGLHITRKTGDRFLEAMILGNLGSTERWTYEFIKAFDYIDQSLEVFCEVGNRSGEQGKYEDLGWLFFYNGEYERAIDHFKQAQTKAIDIGETETECCTMLYLMGIYSSLGDFKWGDSYSERVMEAWHDIESPGRKSLYALNIGWYMHHNGNYQAAEEYCRQSLIFGDQEERLWERQKLNLLAIILERRGKIEEAFEIYQQAASLADQMELTRYSLEAQAGLARVYIARGEIEQALTQVEEILAYMEANIPPKGSSHPLDGTEEPYRILLTCYHALKANRDPRAGTILTEAYNLLQSRAANISDEHLRDCFLNNVTVNREIVEEYEVLGLENGLTS